MDKGRVRQLIALVAAVVFMVLLAVFPNLPFSEEQVMAFFALVGAYILGEGLEGKRVLENLAQLAKSQKFQALLAGIIVVLVKAFWPNAPFTDDQVLTISGVLMAVILGAGAEGLVTRLTK